MATPELIVRSNVLNDNYARQWTDITDYVQSISTFAGRSTELDSIQTGQITIDLDNGDSLFTSGKSGFVKNLLRPEIARPQLVANATQYIGVLAAAAGSFSDARVWSAPGATGAGGTTITSTPAFGFAVPVSPSTSYALRWNIVPAGGSINLQAVIRWFTSAMVFISASTGSAMTDASAITVTATSPGTAAYACVALTNGASWPGGYTVTVDNVQFERGPQTAQEPLSIFYPNVVPGARIRIFAEDRTGNLISNADFTSGSGWTESGTGLISGTAILPGTTAARKAVTLLGGYRSLVVDGANQAFSRSAFANITAGQSYTTAMWIGLVGPGTVASAGIEWYDNASALMYAEYATAVGAVDFAKAGAVDRDSWRHCQLTSTAPVGAVKAKVFLLADNGTVTVSYGRAYLGLASSYQFSDVFVGSIEKWPTNFAEGGDYTRVTATGVDALGDIAAVEIASAYRAAVIGDNPYRYYTLSDLADISGNHGSDAVVKQNKYVAQTVVNGDGGDTSAPTLAGDSSDGASTVWDVPATNGAAQVQLPGFTVVVGQDFVAELWCKLDAIPAGIIGTVSNLFTITEVDNTGYRTCLYLSVNGSGTIGYQGLTTNTYTYAAALSLGVIHHLALQGQYVGGAYELALIVDGVIVDTKSAQAPCAQPSTAGTRAAVGALMFPSGQVVSTTQGAISHVAYYAHANANAVDHYRAGSDRWAGELEGTRIRRILDWADALDPALDPTAPYGLSPLQGRSWSDQSSALSLVLSAAADANGYVFADVDGAYVYHNRQKRLNAATRWVFAESVATGVEPGITLTSDIDNIKNEYAGTQTNGRRYRTYDAASQLQYGKRSDSLTFSVQNPGEVLDAINWRLSQYKDARIRADAVTIVPSTSTALWPAALGARIGDVIQVAELPASAPAPYVLAFVESISHQIVKSGREFEWQTTFNLSPVENTWGWVLEDPIFGVLGYTTKLVY